MFGNWKSAIVLAAWALAPAATLQQLSMDDMARESTAIVRARVVGSSASFTGSTIYTHYKLLVSETWKGTAPAELMIPGGIAGGYRQSFPGAPQLQPGVTEYVLFLWTSRAGITHIIGLTQGLFGLSPQSDGSMLASRRESGETMLDASGRQVQDRGVQLGLNDLKAQVAQSLGTTAAGALK
jgi:hypothetical protein